MRQVFLVAALLIVIATSAFAQMEQIVAEAFCSRNPMQTMGNVDTLINQGIITKEAAGDAAFKAFRQCAAWSYANDMRVTRIFEWNKKDIELPIGYPYGVRYPNNSRRSFVFVVPMKRFEYRLFSIKYGAPNSAAAADLNKYFEKKKELTQTLCLKDTVLSYVANTNPKVLHEVVKNGADINEPFIDKSEDISSAAIEGLKTRPNVLNSNFTLFDGIFFGDGPNENNCDQFAASPGGITYRTVLDHLMSGQVVQNQDNIMAVLKDGAIARPDQLHSFFGPWGWTVHFTSYYPKNRVMFEALLKAGADINGRDEHGMTILGRLLKQPMAPDDLRYLTSKGAKP